MRRALVAIVLLFAGGARADEHGPSLPHSPPPLTLGLRRGAERASARLGLVVDASPHGHDTPPARWRPEGDALVARFADPRFDATLTARSDDDGAVHLDLELRYRQAVQVSREAIRIAAPGPLSRLGRDLTFSTVSALDRVDRGTPILAAGDGIVVEGGDGIVAALYRPADAAHGADAEIELVVDDTDSHPFAVFARCRHDYLPHDKGTPLPRRPPASLEQRLKVDRRPRARGEVVTAHALLYLRPHGAAFTPLVVERWPDGRRAAVVFTDHADRTDSDALRAILHGSSDASATAARGFLGRGLKLTKTFFARPGPGSLDDDPAARALADELTEAGSEVGPHSISPERDSPQAVARGMADFARWHPVTWIDHQPETNCEALANQGWRDRGPFAIRKLLEEDGIRWVWAASDIDLNNLTLANIFTPSRLGRSPLFPLPFDDKLWVFRTTWFFATAKKLAAAVTDAALDRLERERGLFVGHTYLSAWQAKRAELRHKSLVHMTSRGTLEIDEAFDRALGRIAARVHAGTLASLTWSEAGDRLRALASVSVRYLADGTARIENAGADAIHGLTLALGDAGAQLAVAGAAALQQHAGGDGGSWVSFDLPARGAVTVSAQADGRARPLLAGGRVTLEDR